MARRTRVVGIMAASLLATRAALGSDGSDSTQKRDASPSVTPKSAAVVAKAVQAVPPRPIARPTKIRKTGRALDLAIDGEGYFQLMRADDPQDLGMYVTRRGRFQLDNQGHIVLHAAKRDWILTPSLQVRHESALIEITNDGLVGVTDINDLEKPGDHQEMVGNIQLICFPAETILPPCGDGIYRVNRKAAREAGIGSPGVEGRGALRQGCLEESNLDPQEKPDGRQKLQHRAKAIEEPARLLHPAVKPSAAIRDSGQ
jgi:flagellar basal body rod protein FlgG